MFEYKTKSFETGNFGSFDAISDWLNALYKGGFGVKVVGYVCVVDKIVVTVLRWKLSDRSEQEKQTSVRSTIDEIPQEPSINYPEDEPSNQYAKCNYRHDYCFSCTSIPTRISMEVEYT